MLCYIHLLFILLVVQVLKQAVEHVTGGDRSGTFAYADEVGLVAYSAAELQEPTNIWCTVLTDDALTLEFK